MTDAPTRSPQNSAVRVPPHSIDAEESLLGAMLLADTAISAVSSIVQAEDFYKPSHRHVFEAIQSLYGAAQGVDPVTVAEELARKSLLDEVTASLRAAAEDTTNLAAGSGQVQGYGDELPPSD